MSLAVTMPRARRYEALPIAIFLVLALAPFAASFGAETYLLGLFTRVMIYGIPAPYR